MKRTFLAVLAMSVVLALAAPAAAQVPEYIGNITVGLSAVSGQCPGDTITVSGTNAVPGGDVTILFDGEVVAVTQADDDGDYSVTITLPEAAAGEHTITVIDAAGDEISTTFLCVGAAAAPGLAVTGGDFKVWMLLLGGLILVGAVALFASRRRARNA